MDWGSVDTARHDRVVENVLPIVIPMGLISVLEVLQGRRTQRERYFRVAAVPSSDGSEDLVRSGQRRREHIPKVAAVCDVRVVLEITDGAAVGIAYAVVIELDDFFGQYRAQR